MQNWKRFRWMDHTNKIFDIHNYTAMHSFSIDDTLTQAVGDGLSPPIIRLWTHPNTVVLGTPDARLPFIDEAVHMLNDYQHHVIVRNSGGLAVVLDEGILNISLILPDANHLSINKGYEIMLHFIQSMLSDLTNDIRAFEIIGSYCPGDYDLSINGIKFAGISQRRIKKGVAVQIYLDVLGDSHKRAQLIRQFYDLGLKGEKTTFTYPIVNENKMGSLSKLLNMPLTIIEMKQRAKVAITEISEQLSISPELMKEEQAIYVSRYKMMEKRNESIMIRQ